MSKPEQQAGQILNRAKVEPLPTPELFAEYLNELDNIFFWFFNDVSYNDRFNAAVKGATPEQLQEFRQLLFWIARASDSCRMESNEELKRHGLPFKFSKYAQG